METNRYRIESTGNGLFVTITRKSDGKTLFLQGDDAETLLDQIDDTSCMRPNDVCDEYSEMFA